MLKIAICDDEKNYAEYLEWCLQVWAADTANNVRIKKFDDGMPLLESIKVNGMYDLIFLDVEMGKMNKFQHSVFS